MFLCLCFSYILDLSMHILLQYYRCPGPFFKTIFTDRFIWIFSLQCCCLIDEHAKHHLLFIGFYQAYFLQRNADYVMTKSKFARSCFKTNKVDEIVFLISSTSSIFVIRGWGKVLGRDKPQKQRKFWITLVKTLMCLLLFLTV